MKTDSNASSAMLNRGDSRKHKNWYCPVNHNRSKAKSIGKM